MNIMDIITKTVITFPGYSFLFLKTTSGGYVSIFFYELKLSNPSFKNFR